MLLHRFEDDPFHQKLQLAELDYIAGASAGRAALAENYVGLSLEPFD
jgi:hypothetical protein